MINEQLMEINMKTIEEEMLKVRIKYHLANYLYLKTLSAIINNFSQKMMDNLSKIN